MNADTFMEIKQQLQASENLTHIGELEIMPSPDSRYQLVPGK